MSNFRQLITEVKTQMDKDVHFLYAHGIYPLVKYSTVRLYYPEKDSLCILRGPDKESPWFTTGKVSPKDRVIVQLFSENRKKTQSMVTGNFEVDKKNPTMGNTYSKNFNETIKMTVDEYKEKVYDRPENQDIMEHLGFKDLDTEEKRIALANEYQQKRDTEDANAEADYQNWKIAHEDEFDVAINAKDKDELLRKVYALNKDGIEIEDILANPLIIWEFENKKTTDLIQNKIRKIKDGGKKEKLTLLFKKFKKELFKQQNEEIKKDRSKSFQNFKTETLKATVDWWKNLPDNIKESVLNEFTRNNPLAPKPTPIKDPKQVEKALNSLFGNDSGRFLTVPIIKTPVYNKQKYNSPEEDPLADPVEKLIVKRFNDSSNLTDTGTVKVLDIVSHTSYDMNIGELRDLINRPENQDTELNTIEYRLTPGNEFTTLNPGKGGKWIDLPEEVIVKMLETLMKDDQYDYDLLPLVKYYYKEKKTGVPNPQVLKALQHYNRSNFRSAQDMNDEKDFENERQRGATITRRITKDGIKYQGLIPDDGHISVQPGWVSGRFNPYHNK